MVIIGYVERENLMTVKKKWGDHKIPFLGPVTADKRVEPNPPSPPKIRDEMPPLAFNSDGGIATQTSGHYIDEVRGRGEDLLRRQQSLAAGGRVAVDASLHIAHGVLELRQFRRCRVPRTGFHSRIG